MLATLDANGVLTVTPATPIEAYALRRWSEETVNKRMLIKSDRLKVDLELPHACRCGDTEG